MNKYNYKLIVIVLLVSSIWSSCKITKPYTKPATTVTYREPVNKDTTNMATMKWSELFTDTNLQQLISDGLAANLDLKIAVERINQSTVNLKLKKAAFLPSLDGNVSVKESRLAFPQGFGLFDQSTQYDLGITAGWEVDIWGKLKSAKKGAIANLLATDAAKRAVQTQLIANIANAYYELLILDEQLKVLKKTAKNRETDAETIKVLFENSIINGVAVVQSEANFYEAELAIPDIEQKITETEHALCVLLAKSPTKIERSSLEQQKLVYDLKIGVPMQLLANRPDVQQAEYNFRTAFEESNVARAYFYPSLTISGAAGFSSFGLKDWFTNGGLFGNIAGGLTQPIFNKGINKARLATALSLQKEALYNFELSMLKASEEVSNALSKYDKATLKEEKRKKQLEALFKAVDFNKELLNNSTTNYTDVLTAEQNLLNAQLRGIDDQSQKLHAVVNLYRALGGGWN
ncbi:efflux transporter outer membrane subunit [Flavobacterium sp. LS1R47]|uniref:Efflux transporter outer membrane subunit n=1 Tax=Flavobacterium frigoritolerans TaxID=2987686 RepID=A0A9X3C8U8_9FLAO|nr:efflux transporter outer membrane subunit [Flavobacterium frigoritolerans]MCV9933178.1 efflux transporter outer membrane subunit [Flavobacterium frigoritolerans]